MTHDDGHPHRHVAFAAVAVGTFMSTLDASIVNVALPTLAEEFGVGLGAVEWVVLGYLLALAGLMLNAGRAADVLGRGRVYAVGLGIFALASASCAAAGTIPFLVGARVVQGVGGAMMNAAGPAILTAVFPARQRGRVLGTVGLAVSAGLAAGPAIGGLIIDALNWRWIFLPNVPLAVVGALVILRALPGGRQSDAPAKPKAERTQAGASLARSAGEGQSSSHARRERYDVPGAVLLALCLGSLTLGLSIGGRGGFASPAVLGLFGAAVVLGAVFVAVELRHPAPVVDLALFRSRVFRGSAAAGLLVFVTVGAVNLVMPFFLSEAHGLSTGQMGLVLTAMPLALAIVSPLSGWAADRTGSTRAIATTGAVLAALALLVLSRIAETASLAGIAACLACMGLAVGTFQSPNNSALMGAVPRHHLGTAGGVMATVRVSGLLVGNAVGAASFAAVGTSERGLAVAAFVGAGAGLLAALASLARGKLPARA